MTQGNAVRMILTFAIPLFIGNIFQQVYSMVDTMVAGYCLGDQAIAAIGATSSLYGLIINLAWGLFSCLIVYLFGRAIIQFTTGTQNPEVLDNAVMSLRIHFPFFPVLGVLLATRVSMQSMGQKTAPVISSIIELLMKIFAALWLIPSLGFVGVCVTEPVTWVLMTVFLITVYLVKTRKMLTE